MKTLNISFLTLALLALFAAPAANADIVNVEIRGQVEWNMIAGAPLSGALVGQDANLTFTVDSSNFSNNPVYPTRG